MKAFRGGSQGGVSGDGEVLPARVRLLGGRVLPGSPEDALTISAHLTTMVEARASTNAPLRGDLSDVRRPSASRDGAGAGARAVLVPELICHARGQHLRRSRSTARRSAR